MTRKAPMTNPYVVLGVAPTASDAEIKKAYRRIAKDSHPDLNPTDAAAAERFKSASAAYDLLKDPETRARFDRGEIDAQGQEKPQRQYYRDYAGAGADPYSRAAAGGFGGQGFDASDIFADLFGARGGAGSARARGSRAEDFDLPGADLHYVLDVDFLTAARGGSADVALTGGAPIRLSIPRGAAEGQVLRLKGKGMPGTGKAPAGDAMVTLRVADHPHFRRDGNDILLTLPITVDEAALGARIEVPTIDGPVAMTLRPGASSGQTLRLRGRGIEPPAGPRGDQKVELKVVMPKEIDPEMTRFFEEWRQTHAYDPRKGMSQ